MLEMPRNGLKYSLSICWNIYCMRQRGGFYFSFTGLKEKQKQIFTKLGCIPWTLWTTDVKMLGKQSLYLMQLHILQRNEVLFAWFFPVPKKPQSSFTKIVPVSSINRNMEILSSLWFLSFPVLQSRSYRHRCTEDLPSYCPIPSSCLISTAKS